MNVSVLWTPYIKVDTFSSKDFYCKPALVNLSNEIYNVGNLPANGTLLFTLTDPYQNVIFENTTHGIYVSPLDKKYINFTFNFSEEPIGVYKAKASYTYDSKVAEDEYSFILGDEYGKLASAPTSIHASLSPGDYMDFELKFWTLYSCNSSFVTLSTGGDIANWLTLKDTSLLIKPGYTNQTVLTVKVPWDAKEGTYEGYVKACLPNQCINIRVIVDVQKLAIFDVYVDVPVDEVCLGDYVTANISILKIYPEKTIDINITYRLISPEEKVIAEVREFRAIEKSLHYQKSLLLNSDLEGTYYFEVLVTYLNVTFQGYDFFIGKKCVPPPITLPPPPPKPITYEKKILLLLSKHRLFLQPGESTTLFAYVKNEWNGTIEDVQLKIRRLPIGWAFVSPSTLDLPAFNSSEFSLLIKLPESVKEGIYYAYITAVSKDVESNEEVLIITVYKDYKTLAEKALEQLSALKKEIEKDMEALKCLDLKDIEKELREAEVGRNIGLEKFNNKQYKEALEWFEAVIGKYERILYDIKITSITYFRELTVFSLPPFSSSISSLKGRSLKDLEEGKYDDICGNLSQIRKLSFYSLVLLILLCIPLIPIILVLYRIYKKRKVYYALKKLEEVRERLRRI